jgi:voltage-gated potassium channel
LLHSAASATLLVVRYYTAPLDRELGPGRWIGLGLLGFAGVITRRMRAITRSDLPRRAQSKPSRLASAAPGAVCRNVQRDRAQPADSFSEALSLTGALYFTVTVFATVGFGRAVDRTRADRRDDPDDLRADRAVLNAELARSPVTPAG